MQALFFKPRRIGLINFMRKGNGKPEKDSQGVATGFNELIKASL